MKVDRQQAIQELLKISHAWHRDIEESDLLNESKSEIKTSVEPILKAIERGTLVVDQNPKDGKLCLKHNLFEPIGNNSDDTYFIYGRIKVDRMRESDRFKNEESVGKSQAMVAAMANKPIGIISKMDFLDFSLSMKIIEIFFTLS